MTAGRPPLETPRFWIFHVPKQIPLQLPPHGSGATVDAGGGGGAGAGVGRGVVCGPGCGAGPPPVAVLALPRLATPGSEAQSPPSGKRCQVSALVELV
mmetsp:Transcript_57387/g.133786  ORF Transcript_57387/g.133786 Transcript_57387/m.133786 type:complete len:98 (+) Transcript_57387:878-1171(+)